MLRVDAYFFENGEKISVFKNIGIRVDRALQNVSTCDKQLPGDTGTDDIFIPRADYFGSCLFLLFTDMTRVYTTKNVCGNTTTNHYGLLPNFYNFYHVFILFLILISCCYIVLLVNH